MEVRIANENDVKGIMKLLLQVNDVHANIRPDLFVLGKTKYSEDELKDIISNEETPVFVATDGGAVLGHAFCQKKKAIFSENMKDIKTIYIDDICVDEQARGKKVGTLLYDFVVQYAKNDGCYNITLNVWEGNESARKFYENMGMFVRETQMEVIL